MSLEVFKCSSVSPFFCQHLHGPRRRSQGNDNIRCLGLPKWLNAYQIALPILSRTSPRCLPSSRALPPLPSILRPTPSSIPPRSPPPSNNNNNNSNMGYPPFPPFPPRYPSFLRPTPWIYPTITITSPTAIVIAIIITIFINTPHFTSRKIFTLNLTHSITMPLIRDRRLSLLNLHISPNIPICPRIP